MVSLDTHTPGKFAITVDAWTADITKVSFLGVSGHYIEVIKGRWSMRSKILGLKGLSGAHTGENLAGYFIQMLKRVGIVSQDGHKVQLST